MCLIEIKLTKKASEEPDINALMFKYIQFFRRAKIASEEMKGDKFVARVYVRYTENKVSEWINNVLTFDSKIEKVCIVS